MNVTQETRSVACNIPHCGGFYESPGVLAAHLVSEHGSIPHAALIGARHRFGYETKPPRTPFIFTARGQ